MHCWRIENPVCSSATEDALQESEERYRTVVEGSHDAVYIYQDDRFTFVNQRACEITGYTEEELKGINIWSLVHPDDHERLRVIAANRMDGTHDVSTYDARFMTKGGETRYGNFSVRETTYEGRSATTGSVRDVTVRVGELGGIAGDGGFQRGRTDRTNGSGDDRPRLLRRGRWAGNPT